MESASKLLTSVAAILSAVAWPAAIIILSQIFKAELKNAISQMASAIKKLNKAAFAGISLELDRIAEEEATHEAERGGHITPRQVAAATRIKIKAQDVEPQSIFNEVDALGLQYDALRQTLPSGPERTRAMTAILVKMRSLAPSAVKNLENYKKSSFPGFRLAAIAIMQMVPSACDLNWLLDRFSSDQPFIFYHAALALENCSRQAKNPEELEDIIFTSEKAIIAVKNFAGAPDKNTIRVLENIIKAVGSQIPSLQS